MTNCWPALTVVYWPSNIQRRRLWTEILYQDPVQRGSLFRRQFYFFYNVPSDNWQHWNDWPTATESRIALNHTHIKNKQNHCLRLKAYLHAQTLKTNEGGSMGQRRFLEVPQDSSKSPHYNFRTALLDVSKFPGKKRLISTSAWSLMRGRCARRS